MTSRALPLIFAFALSLSAPLAGQDDRPTIAAAAVSTPTLSTLVEALKAADLVETFAEPGEFTVFAPTDSAFAALGKGTLEKLLQRRNVEQLSSVLRLHVVPGRLTLADLRERRGATTLSGRRLAFETAQDGGLRAGGARVVAADVLCSNGVVHLIDAVLLPESKTIPAVAKEAGSFRTLLRAVHLAGLADTLGGEGPFTVLAPTDAAFAALPEGTLASLLKPENRERLAAILRYHVVMGRAPASFALAEGGRELMTVAGQTVRFSTANGVPEVSGARILATDVEAANGVIHVIDRVLVPEAPERVAARRRVTELRESLERATELGSPLYNEGQRAACAAIYETTLGSVIAARPIDVPDDLLDRLAAALDRARNIEDDGERAWALRRGLDALYEFLDNLEDEQARLAGRH